MAEDIFEPSGEVAEEFRRLLADPAARQAFVTLRAQHADDGTTRQYRHILRAVSSMPWAIVPEMLGVIVDVLAFRAAGGKFTPEELAARVGAGRTQTTAPQGVAVIPLHGVIMPKASAFSEMSGGTSIESFRSQFRAAMNAPDVASIVLDVDSPGGTVGGVPEMASEIRAARGTKPIVAVANTMAASAAYWLATQADELVVSKSGVVGSIGVFSAHEDESARQEAQGIRTTLVSAGKFKTEGNPFEPLSAEAKAHMQSMVDDFYGMFVSDVARGRGVGVQAVRSGFGQGRVENANEAVKAGMADRIGTLDEVIGQELARENRRATAAALEAGWVSQLSEWPANVSVSAFSRGPDEDEDGAEATPEIVEEPAEDDELVKLRAELAGLTE